MADKIFSKNISISHQMYYQNKGKFRKLATEVAALVHAALPHLEALLDYDANKVQIDIRGTKAKNNFAMYYDDRKLVVIDPRMFKGNPEKAIASLAHELVHAEQYHTGRMKNVFEGRRWVRYYEGQRAKGRGTTYRAYLNLPWEKEAFSRMNRLANVAMEKMGFEFHGKALTKIENENEWKARIDGEKDRAAKRRERNKVLDEMRKQRQRDLSKMFTIGR